MIKVIYRKTQSGPVVVEARDADQNRPLAPIIERFNAFFDGVPLHGGREWKTLDVDMIVTIFREAATEIVKEYQRRRDQEVLEHLRSNFVMRWWRSIRGWKSPTVPSRDMILQDMATRCSDLSKWMQSNSSRSFYAGSDMSHFIDKPKAVAKQLGVS